MAPASALCPPGRCWPKSPKGAWWAFRWLRRSCFARLVLFTGGASHCTGQPRHFWTWCRKRSTDFSLCFFASTTLRQPVIKRCQTTLIAKPPLDANLAQQTKMGFWRACPIRCVAGPSADQPQFHLPIYLRGLLKRGKLQARQHGGCRPRRHAPADCFGKIVVLSE